MEESFFRPTFLTTSKELRRGYSCDAACDRYSQKRQSKLPRPRKCPKLLKGLRSPCFSCSRYPSRPAFSSLSNSGHFTLTLRNPSALLNPPRPPTTRFSSSRSPMLRSSSTTRSSLKRTSTSRRASRRTRGVLSCSLSRYRSKFGTFICPSSPNDT